MDEEGATSTNSKIMPISRTAAGVAFVSQYPATVAAYKTMMNARDEHHRPPSPPLMGSFSLPNAKSATNLPHANNTEHSQLTLDHHESARLPYINQHHSTPKPSLPNSWFNDGEIVNDADRNADVEHVLTVKKRLDVTSAKTPPEATNREGLLDLTANSPAHSQKSSSLSAFVKPLPLPRHADLSNASSLILPDSIENTDSLTQHQPNSASDSVLVSKSNDSFNAKQPPKAAGATSSAAKQKKPFLQKHLDPPAEVIVDVPSEIAVKLQNFLLFPDYNPDKDDIATSPLQSSYVQPHASITTAFDKSKHVSFNKHALSHAADEADRSSLRPGFSGANSSSCATTSSATSASLNKPWSRNYHYPLSLLKETRPEPTGNESIGYQLHRLGVLAIQFENGVAFNLPAYRGDAAAQASQSSKQQQQHAASDTNAADFSGDYATDANHASTSSSSVRSSDAVQDADGKPKKRGRGRRRKEEFDSAGKIIGGTGNTVVSSTSPSKTAYYKKRAAAVAAAAAKLKAQTRIVIGNSWAPSLGAVPESDANSATTSGASAATKASSQSSGTFVNPNKVKTLDQNATSGGSSSSSALPNSASARGRGGGTGGATTAAGTNKRQRATPAKRGPRTAATSAAAATAAVAGVIVTPSTPKSKVVKTTTVLVVPAGSIGKATAATGATPAPVKSRAPKRQKTAAAAATTSIAAITTTTTTTVNSKMLVQLPDAAITLSSNILKSSTAAMSHAISSSSTTTTPTSISSGNGAHHAPTVSTPKARAPKQQKAAAAMNAAGGPAKQPNTAAAGTKAAVAAVTKKASGGSATTANKPKPPQQQRQPKQTRPADAIVPGPPIASATPIIRTTIVAPPASAAVMLHSNALPNSSNYHNNMQSGSSNVNVAAMHPVTNHFINAPPVTGNGIIPVTQMNSMQPQQQHHQHFGGGSDLHLADHQQQQQQYHFHPPSSASLVQLPMAAPLAPPIAQQQQRLLSSSLNTSAAAAVAGATARFEPKMNSGVNVVQNSPLLVSLLKSGTTPSSVDAPAAPSAATYTSSPLLVMNTASGGASNNNTPVLTALSAVPGRVVASPSSSSTSSSLAANAITGGAVMNAVGANNSNSSGGNVVAASLDRRLLSDQHTQPQRFS